MKILLFLALFLTVFSRLPEDFSTLSNYNSFRQQMIKLELEFDFETKTYIRFLN